VWFVPPPAIVPLFFSRVALAFFRFFFVKLRDEIAKGGAEVKCNTREKEHQKKMNTTKKQGIMKTGFTRIKKQNENPSA
jgi:hypothetical protein